ncbi:hypothetical protein C7B76_10410 [filamentous cyanobacterium CCP2]|nr:hypothetical protein C7B76_10410 [filamentous cyanobacterium CCP2]
MTYRERLNHWAVIRLLPNCQRVVIDRFRSRSSKPLSPSNILHSRTDNLTPPTPLTDSVLNLEDG